MNYQGRSRNGVCMGIVPKLGDVFLVPSGNDLFGVGQIVGNFHGELYIIIYDTAVNSRDYDIQKSLNSEPLIASLSLDAKIYHGDWPVVGNFRENIPSIYQPCFKIEQDGHMYVESRDRSISRIASETEQEILRFRTVVAPIRIENALKALRGFGEWLPIFEKLKPEYLRNPA